ncbi:NADH-FMN oxidoreductase RutF, flavin reductase (DIM6/NTAB) family [Agromyces sp. CF514]|uniref:flavin reductase family protein n=1 Tax=Agromyces sp. CF514 TaxID=1881031 RepID=UPI0008ED1E98|nr:flavin reductase family protein [Agromyces sp. CF514]SFR68958.1 NADH-FMN oxidoreductase RutF, flavin reductase (DIM6/NTAB) family [Agromyces sp. CF514]
MGDLSTLVPPSRRHVAITPAILYFGTPVSVLSTLDEHGHPNLAPNSSLWWLGQTAMVGVAARSRTGRNLVATGEIVINLPSVAEVDEVDRLALTTGNSPVSARKAKAGYRHVRDKFAAAGVRELASETVAPPRIAEFPVHVEGRVRAMHPLGGIAVGAAGAAAGTPDVSTADVIAFEIEVTRVHVLEELRMPAHANRIDPRRWRPLMMSFQHFFGFGPERMPSRLSTIDEEWYRG